MGNEARKKKSIFYLHWCICLGLMLFFQYVPTVGSMTQYGMQIFGIFLGLLWGWMFLDFLNPSFAALLIVILFVPDATFTTMCAQGIGNQNVLMMIVVLALAQYFEDSGLNQYLADWFVSRKINVGRPWIFCGVLIFAAFFFSAFAQIMPAMVLMWSIVYKIAKQVGIPKKDKWITFMVVGITMGASYGCIAAPWQVMGLIFIAAMSDAVGVTVNMGIWCILFLLFTVASILLYLFIGRFLLRVDVSKIRNEEDLYADLRSEKMNSQQKCAWIIMLIFIVLLMAPNFLPATLPLMAQLNTLTVTGVIILMLLLIHFLRDENGEERFSVDALMKRSTMWSMIIMCSMCFPLINMMETDEAGVTATAVELIMPVVSNMGFIPMTIFIAMLLGILTQFLHNMVLGLIFIPVFAKIAVSMGESPIIITIAISAALMTSMSTPAASSQSALMFGNTVNCAKSDLFKMGFLCAIIGIICVAGVLVPASSMIF